MTEYICENCNYRGDRYGRIKWSKTTMLNPTVLDSAFRFISPIWLTAVCPQCGQEAIKFNLRDIAIVPGSLYGKRWTTKSLIVLIFIVLLIVIGLPIASVYFK